MAKLYTEDHFWSAVKRKSMSEVLSIMFTQGNCPLAATAANETTRMTDAAITRMRDALAKDMDGPDAEAIDEALEEGCDPVTDAEDEANAEASKTEKSETVSGSIEEHNDIIKAIKKGKGKKALKLIAKAREGGAKGSELKKLEKQAKEL